MSFSRKRQKILKVLGNINTWSAAQCCKYLGHVTWFHRDFSYFNTKWDIWESGDYDTEEQFSNSDSEEEQDWGYELDDRDFYANISFVRINMLCDTPVLEIELSVRSNLGIEGAVSWDVKNPYAVVTCFNFTRTSEVHVPFPIASLRDNCRVTYLKIDKTLGSIFQDYNCASIVQEYLDFSNVNCCSVDVATQWVYESDEEL